MTLENEKCRQDQEITVLIVDDEYPARKQILSMLDSISGFRAVGEARNGEDGLLQFENLSPDIVLTDIEMPVMDGLEMIRRIREKAPAQVIIILSCYESFAYAQEAIRCGAQDYLIKDMTTPRQLESVLSRFACLHERSAFAAQVEDSQAGSADTQEQAPDDRTETEDISPSEVAAIVLPGKTASLSDITGIPAWSMDEIDTQMGDLSLAFLSHNEAMCSGIVYSLMRVPVQGMSQFCFLQYIVDMLVTWTARECIQYTIAPSEIIRCDGSPLDILLREKTPEEAVEKALEWMRELFSRTETIPFSSRTSNIILYISAHYREDLSLQVIADRFNISTVHLSRSFKAETKKNIVSYINTIRIEKAKLLLSQGQYQINEVAYMVGFHNMQNFHNSFRKVTGCSPGEYSEKFFNSDRWKRYRRAVYR